MKKIRFFLPLMFISVPLMAQAVPERESKVESKVERKADGTTEQKLQRDQRRSDLRLALDPKQKKNDESADATLVDRHLTAQERADMRQQLRQQRRDAERAKP